jgi:8-oxo-dGTP pyrophosphatase MutT (NUDIX family)
MQHYRSAGGVVVLDTLDGPRVGVIHHRADNQWRLPKGHLEAGETPELAAVREVREELGAEARIVRRLGTTQYTFTEPDQPLASKAVTYYLMTTEAPGEGIEDETFDGVVWLPFAAAATRLEFDNEREMVQLAGQNYTTPAG